MSEKGNPLGIAASDWAIVEQLIEPAAPKVRQGLTVNEGFRIVCLGETGSGKTTLMRAIVYGTIAKCYSNFALIHDTKSFAFPEYPKSIMSPDVATFRARGFQPSDIPVVSFRGDPRADVSVTAEEVARYSKWLAQKGRIDPATGRWTTNPHELVIEELAAAASGGRKHVSAPSVLWALEQGRKVGVSVLGTTQSVRKVPLDILEQSSAIVFFRLTGSSSNYLSNSMGLDPNMIQTIAGPNGEGLPNYSFCLYMKSVPWDGEIHRLDPRTARMFE